MMDHMNISYKEYHENYLSGHEGGGLLDVPLTLSPVLLLGFIAVYLRCLVGYKNHFVCFLLDFVCTVLPCTLLVTVLSEQLTMCLLILLIPFTLTIFRELFFRKSTIRLSEALRTKVTLKRRPFVTNFKAIVSLLSVICILAVDFTIFPKRFIKTEAYGYSLMDTGVGFFVVANALTCNLKETNSRKLFISNVPILILGFVRYLTTEKIRYQKHVTEYGVHWNFFFTLAIVKFLGPYLASKFPPKWYLLTIWCALHEVVLKAGLEPWVMSDAPRTNLLSANREGIVSILGYLYLYVVGVHLGTWLLYASPKPQVKEEMKKGLKCFMLFLIVTIFLHISRVSPSRRLANPAFVIWMMSIIFFVLGLSILLESLIEVFCRRMNCGAHQGSTLFILEAICANNLAFFLIGNLLTGAVNMSTKTLLVPPSISLLIVILYICVNTGIISLIYSKNVALKYW